MSSNWKEVKFSDLCTITRGASPRPIKEYVQESGMPWVKIADATATNGRIITSTKECIKSEGVRKSVEVYPGDLILTNSATPGLPMFVGINACIHDGWMLLRDLKGLDKNFAYWLLLHERRNLVMQGNGSVFTNLKTDILKNHIVKIPSIEEQKSIALRLNLIAKKIELNQQTNETQEAMAQAIFKSWFVDFDPVLAKIKAKADGLDPNRAAMAAIAGVSLVQAWDAIDTALQQKLDRMTEDQRTQLRQTAELFPDELVDSEIGEVPKWWGIKPFKEVCEDIQSGGTPKRSEPEYWGKGLSWLSSGEIRNKYLLNSEEQITEKGLAESNAKLWPSGSTIIAMYGATAGVTAYLAKEMCANQACCCLMPNKNSAFVFISALRASRELSGKSTGSAQQNLNKGIIERHKILVPQDEIIDVFEKFSSQLIDRIISNEEENESLSDLRDMLLPKLISGEVGV